MRTPTLVRIAAGLALAAALTACGSSDPSGTSGSANGGTAADVSFAQLMIPHHQQAVEMADLALAQASSAQVKQLAAQIKSAQDPEIAQMTGWLEEWGEPTAMPGSEDGGMEGMDHSGMDMGGVSASGMMTAEDMAGLGEARGAEFDRMWLSMMIAHHQGAITMAQQVLETTSDSRVKSLADAIIEGQTKEIDTMKQLLAS